MKLAAFASLFFVFAITGCYKPHVQNGGFACSSSDSQPCPNGFFCVNGLCVDSPSGGGSGGGGGGGSAGGGGGGGGGSAGGGGGGGGMVSGDMSMRGADMMSMPQDMAMSPLDMSCLPYPYQCNSDPTCCAKCCAGGCALAGNCALF